MHYLELSYHVLGQIWIMAIPYNLDNNELFKNRVVSMKCKACIATRGLI